jgi:hypothetical protein
LEGSARNALYADLLCGATINIASQQSSAYFSNIQQGKEPAMATHMSAIPTGFATPSSGAPQQKPVGSFLSQIGQAIDSVAGFFGSIVAAQRTADYCDRLVRLSDAELSARGLKREDIPNHILDRMHNRR